MGKVAVAAYGIEYLNHLFEPYGWHNILATLDVCTNVHATKHHDDEGYDIMYTYMGSFILDFEKKETKSSQYDEEINIEGPNMDHSRVITITLETT